MTKRAVAASLKKMDNEQDKNEKTLDKASILENEPNAKSLGRTKVSIVVVEKKKILS